MRLRLFLVAAVVLAVFAIIAFASTTGLCLTIGAGVWFAASFLAFLTDCMFGGWGYHNGGWGRDSNGNPVA